MLEKFYTSYTATKENKEPVDELLNKYSNKFPEELIEIWKTHGICSFNNGLFSLINPEESTIIIEALKSADELFSLEGKEFTVFAKSAFGDLFIYLEEEDEITVLFYDILYTNYSSFGDEDFDFMLDVSMTDPLTFKRELSEDLFNQCLEKLGPLEADECYGFSPIPALGGDKSIEYAEKVKLKEYLSICAQAVS